MPNVSSGPYFSLLLYVSLKLVCLDILNGTVTLRKIDALVNEGVKDTREMKRHLNVYVKQQILSKDEIQPSPSNRRFFPKPSDIRSHMYRASVKNQFSKIDQENVVDNIDQWQSSNPGDFFYFRPYGETH